MRRLVVVLGFVLVLALSLVAAAGARESVTAPPVTFSDTTGDGGTAADIASLTVTNDDKGQYTFVTNFATPYPANGDYYINLDTDLNPSTGDPQLSGADYVIFDNHSQHTFDLEKWTGSEWDDAPTNSTLTLSIGSDGKSLTASVNASEIGNSTGFNLWLSSDDGSTGTDPSTYDTAPNGTATWQYKEQTVFTLSAVGRQGAATAGKTWAIYLAAVRSDTGKTVGSDGTITCGAASGFTKLATATHAFVTVDGQSVAFCVFKVPKSLKHKSVKGTISVSYGGQTATHTFATTVK
jgi:hypothetical protein